MFKGIEYTDMHSACIVNEVGVVRLLFYKIAYFFLNSELVSGVLSLHLCLGKEENCVVNWIMFNTYKLLFCLWIWCLWQWLHDFNYIYIYNFYVDLLHVAFFLSRLFLISNISINIFTCCSANKLGKQSCLRRFK